MDAHDTRILATLLSRPERRDAVPLEVGEMVAGRYVLSDRLGEGGMGAVFRAHDVQLDEVVALKVLKAGSGPEVEILFRGEVKLARKITHPNVARIFDFGAEGALYFLTMELIEGDTIAHELHRRGAIPPEEVAAWLGAVARGLAAVHEAGVIHRDVKPHNVLRAREGRVALTDFGIALSAQQDGATTGLIGTPDYMSPEQVRGVALTPKSDVYSLAVMGFELLAGRRPFAGDSELAVALARLERAPPPLLELAPRTPRRLAELLGRGLSLDPQDRPSAQELADALGSVRDAPTRLEASPRAPEGLKLAVLPFAASADAQELADGLVEDLVDALSAVRGLRVLSTRSSARVAGDPRGPEELGRALGVDLIVEGSVRGPRLSVRVLRASDGSVALAHRAELTPSALFKLTDELAAALSEALGLSGQRHVAEGEVDPQAVALYLEGRGKLVRFEDGGVPLLEAALARAPDHPLFTAALAYARVRSSFGAARARAGELELARETAARAVALAPKLAESHLALAIAALHSNEPAQAVRSLRRAVALGPSVSDAHALLGELSIEIGRVDEGAERLRTALSLDGGSLLARLTLSRAYAVIGDWDRAYALAGPAGATRGPVAAIRTRYAAWRSDEAELRAMLAVMPETARDLADAIVRGLATAALERKVIPELDVLRTEASGSSRRAILGMQVITEVAMLARDPTAALDAVEQADARGLLDRFWLERCPLLGPLQTHDRFRAVHARTRARAEAVLDALWS